MLKIDVGGYAMPYIEMGQGEPLLLVHGSMSDFRVWSPVLGPLSQHFRVIALSLRHFFPAQWNGAGDTFSIAQHTADLIAFAGHFGGPVHWVGHSRGGHLAFRVAQQRPDLVHSLCLAEPGGDLDASLQPVDEPVLPPLRATFVAARDKIAAGDIDGGLELFRDAIDGAGAWPRLPAALKQELRDNAATLLGQVDEGRLPYTRADVDSIHAPTLLLVGEHTKQASARNVRVFAARIAGAQTAVIPRATHMMMGQAPQAVSDAITTFIASLRS
jgi:pimeloyl-ACP methyl ester carboxylesterase